MRPRLKHTPTPSAQSVSLMEDKRPKAVASLKPGKQVFREETVTLRCDIQGGGDTEWGYSWNKEGYTHNSLSPTQENIIYSVKESDSGIYTCRGERRSDSQRSEISDAVTLTVSDRAQAVLRVSPQSWLTEGDSVTLSCEVRGSSTGWTFSWYRDNDELLSGSSRGAGGSYTLSPAVLNHTGVYVCRATRGEPAYHTQYSNPQSLWITDGFVILDSPVHPVTEGDPLTLRCLYHYTKPSNLTAEFYKNESLLQTQTTGEMTIRTVLKSDEGLYHCKHPDKGESPQSWILVRAAVDLVGVVVGVSFAVLFIILLILLWCYRTKKDGQSLSRFTGRKQNINQRSVQHHRESGAEDSQSRYMPAGDAHVYDTVERAGDAADELSDVTYLQVMIKNKKSKNKGKYIPAKPSQTETIYSEVQPGKATDADTGSMEVTYAEIELKTKKKPKKKQEQTSVDADTVYSELKQNTDKGDVTGLDNSTSL
ncbi:hypothetical protein MHYP_G00013210 [Metynnis hypsauchen]